MDSPISSKMAIQTTSKENTTRFTAETSTKYWEPRIESITGMITM